MISSVVTSQNWKKEKEALPRIIVHLAGGVGNA
jgi:hypothetical protein